MSEISKVDAGPRQVSYRAVVNTNVEELFALIANPHRHSEFDGSGTVRAEVIGPRRLEAGDRFTVQMKMHGLPYKITSSVTKLYPPRLVEWRHPAGHRWRFELEPVGDDQTAITETWDYSGKRRGRMYELLKFPAANAKGIKSTLARLQELYP